MDSAPSWHLRPATLDDAGEMARLTSELGYPAVPAAMRERLAALLSRADRFVAVAAGDGGRLLGWIAAEQRWLLHYDTRAELIGLVVSPEARRRGIGQRLVAAAEQWALARGLSSVLVRSSATRLESHPFYARLGYQRQKTQHVYAKSLGHPDPSSG